MARIKMLCGEWRCGQEFPPQTPTADLARHAVTEHAGGQPVLRLGVRCPNCEDTWMRMAVAIDIQPMPRQKFYCDECTTSLTLRADA